MNCPICPKSVESQGLCPSCERRIQFQLDDLLELWVSAHSELTPGSGGHGSSSSERPIGINVSALSFIAGDDILKILHSWEQLIRQDRNLTPPAHLFRKPLGEEILDAIDFAKTHLQWSATQEWIKDYADEIKALHTMGMGAARKFVPKTKRIACPADNQEGLPCGSLLAIDEDLGAIIECRKCKTEWTAIRLIAVALADTRREVWLDAEAIAEYVGIGAKQVYKIAKIHDIPKRGQLFSFNKFLATRNLT